ncbi:nucleotidyltransferase substrate binding protein [Candidatus Magnetomorum sp. HK-1]|nr:nucleotidyltransferase substrate binding protein [Candidatus Magnetomorum sp. HK-1]
MKIQTNINDDIRWMQRFSNYKKALSQLEKFIIKGSLTDLEEQGLIKAFEYTFELAWNTIKDFFEYKGQTGIYGSRDAIRKAFESELIDDGENWMDMLINRNKTCHTYNEDTAKEISTTIINTYYSLFKKLESKFENLINDEGKG